MNQFEIPLAIDNRLGLFGILGMVRRSTGGDVQRECRIVRADKMVMTLDGYLTFGAFDGSDFNGIAPGEIRLANGEI